MNGRVLILNQDLRALTVCSVQKAFVLLYLNKAEMISDVDDYFIRSISAQYPMPSVIKLQNYVNVPYKNVALTRQNIFKRDGGCCQYCGSQRDLTLDHVHPRSRGGATSWDNLITACKRCNSRKGDNTPEEANMPLKYKPYRPSFIMFLRDFTDNHHSDWNHYLGSKRDKKYKN